MLVKVKHEKENGWIYGTLSQIRLSDVETVFCMLLDTGDFGDLSGLRESGNWWSIEGETLSDVCSEAERQGLSDIRPQ